MTELRRATCILVAGATVILAGTPGADARPDASPTKRIAPHVTKKRGYYVAPVPARRPTRPGFYHYVRGRWTPVPAPRRRSGVRTATVEAFGGYHFCGSCFDNLLYNRLVVPYVIRPMEYVDRLGRRCVWSVALSTSYSTLTIFGEYATKLFKTSPDGMLTSCIGGAIGTVVVDVFGNPLD